MPEELHRDCIDAPKSESCADFYRIKAVKFVGASCVLIQADVSIVVEQLMNTAVWQLLCCSSK